MEVLPWSSQHGVFALVHEQRPRESGVFLANQPCVRHRETASKREGLQQPLIVICFVSRKKFIHLDLQRTLDLVKHLFIQKVSRAGGSSRQFWSAICLVCSRRVLLHTPPVYRAASYTNLGIQAHSERMSRIFRSMGCTTHCGKPRTFELQ